MGIIDWYMRLNLTALICLQSDMFADHYLKNLINGCPAPTFKCNNQGEFSSACFGVFQPSLLRGRVFKISA